jgi:hypothetical protein
VVGLEAIGLGLEADGESIVAVEEVPLAILPFISR